MNQDEYFQANQVDGVLTDVQMAEMVTLPVGDSTDPVQGSASPDAATDDTTQQTQVAQPEEPKAAEPKPVILAKDGVHTIPFEQLEAAREAERQAKAAEDLLRGQVEQLQAQLAAATAQPAAVAAADAAAPAPETPQAIDPDLFGDFSEEALAKGIETVVERRTATLVETVKALQQQLLNVTAPIEQAKAEEATKAHFDAIHAKHPDSDTLVQSPEFTAWVEAQPSFARDGLKAVVEQGTAEQVIEMLDAYRKVHPAGSTSAAAVAAAAQAAIAKARSPAPTSLSEIPAGVAAHHDEAAAMLDRSPEGMLSMFEGKTPEQINALMSKAI